MIRQPTMGSGGQRISFSIVLLGIALLFGLAHSQHPLYSTNQNTYFLHGLTGIGESLLHEDVLAQGTDPTPVFSRLVHLTARWGHTSLFYIYYLIILGLYAISLVGIVRQVKSPLTSRQQVWLFFTFLIIVHSYIFHKLLSPLQTGLADQYVLGKVFQPSVFGVFLFVSVWLYLDRRPIGACLAAGMSVVFHPTYALTATSLILAYGLVSWKDHVVRRRLIVGIGLLAVLAIPLMIMLWRQFQPTSPELFSRVSSVLINERIPHHADPGYWFGFGSVVRLIIVGAGIWLVRRTPLGRIMLIVAAIGAALSVWQMVTDSPRLALLFPWRASVVLVPIAAAVLLADCTIRFLDWLKRKRPVVPMTQICLLVMFVLAAVGVGRFVYLGWVSEEPTDALHRQVRSTRRPGQVYLIPTRWQDFRLATGTPVYVDHKSHPYVDVEVLAWHARLTAAERFYANRSCELLDSLRQFGGVTHVVFENTGSAPPCPGLEFTWTDGDYSIARIRPHPN